MLSTLHRPRPLARRPLARRPAARTLALAACAAALTAVAPGIARAQIRIDSPTTLDSFFADAVEIGSVNTNPFTVNIVDGAVFDYGVAAFNNAHLEVTGGTFAELYLMDGATANVSGGSGFLSVYSETAGDRFTISGGSFSGLWMGLGDARISGGSLDEVSSVNPSNLTITGGTVKRLDLASGSTLALSGGSVGADGILLGGGGSAVTVSGSGLSLASNGTGFDMDGMRAYSTYSLGGALGDGSALQSGFRVYGEASVTSNTGAVLAFNTSRFADDFVDTDATRSGVVRAPYTFVGQNTQGAVTLDLNDALAFQLQAENNAAVRLNGSTQVGGAYITNDARITINDDARVNFGLQLGEGYTDANAPRGEQNGGFVAGLSVGDSGAYVQNGGTIGTGQMGYIFLNSNRTATYTLNGGTVLGGIYNYSGNVFLNGGTVLGGIDSEFGITDINGGAAVTGNVSAGSAWFDGAVGGVVNVRGGDLANAILHAFGAGTINFYGSDFSITGETAWENGYEYRLTGLLAGGAAPSSFTFRSGSGYGRFSFADGVFSARANGTTAVVPEPATLALFATGALLGLLAPVARRARRGVAGG